ncbi:MAG TPA: tetratricopeptide repeat protein [Thermoanaerobaculia bacterium]|jgi:predicted negative regulator of RcsB-dependent stress response|nr:tetratricopeptide repeat protein [Thermoanaerobaculia bacterium]
MRAFVFTDKALAKHAGQFVWLSIDTEKAQNAAFAKKYPIRAWPSFYVIDSAKEEITLRWVGGATVAELGTLFDEAGGSSRGKPAQALARADALYSEGKYAESIPAYRDALKAMPKSAPSYPRTVEALLFSLSVSKQPAECVAVARAAMPAVRHTPAAAVVAGSGLDCALGLAPDAPGKAASVAEFERDASAVLADPKLHLVADDRSALYSSLVDVRRDANDAEGADRLAREWVADLDRAAAAAKTPEQWTALDPDRLSAFEAAGEIAKAIPMLEKSAREFPEDYNPPARLALVYLKVQKYDAALAASDEALAKVYGPRKLRVLAVRADIYKAMGDAAAARKTLEDALSFAEALPPGQRSESQIASLKQQLGG